jgi:transposase
MAQLITARFGWYLPWHRLEKMLAAEGVNLVRSTMTRWAAAIALKKLRPLFDALAKDIKFNSKRLFMDETTLPILVQGNGKTKTSYLYALHRDDRSFGGNLPSGVVYFHRPGRGMNYIHDILAGVTAVVQTDAYSGYARFGFPGTPVANITPANCWAHARRKFTDEFEFNRTPDAAEVVSIVDELYSIESDIRGKPPNARSAVRR